MKLPRGLYLPVTLLLLVCAWPAGALSQEKVRLAHSALESSNGVWYVAQDRGFYKKHGLDAELLFIPTTHHQRVEPRGRGRPRRQRVGWRCRQRGGCRRRHRSRGMLSEFAAV